MYASWDFNGKAGYQDIQGMVMIDGAPRGAFGAVPERAKILSDLAELSQGLPFSQILPGAPTYYTGVLPELAALYALKSPRSNSALQGLLNNAGFGAFTRPVSQGKLSNDSGLAYAFDRDTSPQSFSLFHMNMGSLVESKTGPAGWRDGGLTDLADLKNLFGTRTAGRGDFVEWYFPRRLSIEVGAASQMTHTSLMDELGLRTWHLAHIDRPLYAFETGLTCQARPKIIPGNRQTALALDKWVQSNTKTNCGILNGAKAMQRASQIRKSFFASDHNQEHLDPLVARSRSNKMQSTLLAFIRSLGIR